MLVTRPRPEADELAPPAASAGARRAIVAPAIELAPVRSAALTTALRELADGAFAWVTLTSPRTVRRARRTPDAAASVRAKVAAVGEGTAEAFRRWSRRDPDLVPKAFTTAALGRAFPRGNGRVLYAARRHRARGSRGRPGSQGLDPDARRRLPDAHAALAPGRGPGRAARGDGRRRHVHERLDRPRLRAARSAPSRANPKVVCIGPVTAREAREHGLSRPRGRGPAHDRRPRRRRRAGARAAVASIR